MPTLVIGSIAKDNISLYDGNLKESIEKETINGKINSSIILKSSENHFGGTGLNICYNLSLLGDKPILSGAVGLDFKFEEYIKENVNLDYIYTSELLESSHSYITKDNFGNQFSVFYPGAIEKADSLRIEDITTGFNYAIISATKKEAMFELLDELSNVGVKIFFDPGQQLSIMKKNDLEKVMEKANYLILNKHKFSLFKRISELSAKEIVSKFEKVIVTFSEKGSKILNKESVIEIEAVKNDNIVDTTGAGEAYRAGLIRGLELGYSWETSAKIGSLISSYSLSSHGAQNHFIEKKQFEMWFADEYKEFIKL